MTGKKMINKTKGSIVEDELHEDGSGTLWYQKFLMEDECMIKLKWQSELVKE